MFTMIEGAFAQERLLQIFRDFIFFPDDSKKEETIICRYPQFFAAKKMLASLNEHIKTDTRLNGMKKFLKKLWSKRKILRGTTKEVS